MTQTPGFVDADRPNHVCRLRKAIYGLKQAPRAWYLELKTPLLSAGFRNSVADTSLFTLHLGSHYVYLSVYVDDILVTSSSSQLIQRTLDDLTNKFSIKDPESLHYFLGVEVIQTPTGLYLMQRKYTKDLLADHDMLHAKPVSKPMASSPKLTLHSRTSLSDGTKYRTLLGRLQYLSFTRPDIAYTVNLLSQFMHHPTEDHWQAAKRILRYLAGTQTHGLFLAKLTPHPTCIFRCRLGR